MLARAIGASVKVKRLSIAAATQKIAADTAVKAQTNATESIPAGSARVLVRGLLASISRSAIRLNAIAVERAPIIAIVIQSVCQAVGSPPAASTAPKKAKGSANSVCSIFIISSVMRALLIVAVNIF